MLGLSLTQPWASLMASGRKHNETRSWSASYRGELAIAASARMDREDKELAKAWGIESPPLGAIVAVVRLYDVRPTDGFAPGMEKAYGDYSPGRWVWLTDSLQKLATPVPVSGRLGLWPVLPELEEMVRAQLGIAAPEQVAPALRQGALL